MRLPRQYQSDRLVRGTRLQLSQAVDELSRGNLDYEEFIDRMQIVLQDRHGMAAALGRQRAGLGGLRDSDDDGIAELVMDNEAIFLTRFRDKLQDGGYLDEDGALMIDRIRQRALMYAERTIGTMNESFVLASEPDALFWWRLSEIPEEHCPDCPEMAAASPWRGERMPTYPKANDTQCKYNCYCYLEREDGRAGFKPTLTK